MIWESRISGLLYKYILAFSLYVSLTLGEPNNDIIWQICKMTNPDVKKLI